MGDDDTSSCFEDRDRVLPADIGKVLQELVERVAAES
jgi:hypothetical protein